MALNIGKEMTALKRMTVPELRRKYAAVFGEDTMSRHKEFLIRRIVWRIQVNEEGGLSERARQRARELADGVRRPPDRAPTATCRRRGRDGHRPDRIPQGRPTSHAWGDHHAPIQEPNHRSAGPAKGVRVRGRHLPDPERRGQAGHRHALERVSFLQVGRDGVR